MTSREIVRRAIEFRTPPRLPFWQHESPAAPDDVCDIWELDRAESGWFFDRALPDDWGCGWADTDVPNMGQVIEHPLADWSALDGYRPPDPRNPFYFKRIEEKLGEANDRYVVVTSHFNLIERLHMLRGFEAALEDLYLEPDNIARVLDMILEHKLGLFDELHQRFGDAIDGLFLTDDWGTQQGCFIGPYLFDQFFLERYRTLFSAIHSHGWHVILHSCGRINDLVPRLIDAGADVLNMQQPCAYGPLDAFGDRFAGQVTFLTTVDIQSTLPGGDEQRIREEARQLVKHWSTPEGGFIVFNYGDPDALAVRPEVSAIMFDEFAKLKTYWHDAANPGPRVENAEA